MSFEKNVQNILKLILRLEHQLSLAKEEKNENPRQSAKAALRAVIDFVSSIPAWNAKGLATPLFNLRMALLDLDSGTVPPLLAVSAIVKNRPNDPIVKSIRKAFAVAGVDRLMATHMGLEDACRFVSEEFRKAKIDIGRRDAAQWKTVKQWRYDLRRRPSDDPTCQLVEDFKDKLPPASTLADTKQQIREDIATRIATLK
jgi:hypothetical protein